MAKKKIIKMEIGEDDFLGFRALSLVDYPAIEQNFIALAAVHKLTRMDDERRMVYGPVLIPEKPILRINQQTQEEYYIVFSRDVIRKLAYGMMKKARQAEATVMHAVPVGGCTIVETWLKEGESDKSIHLGLKSMPDGTWFTGMKVDDEQVWTEIKAGTLRGFSIEAMMNEVETQMARDLSPEEQELIADIEAAIVNS